MNLKSADEYIKVIVQLMLRGKKDYTVVGKPKHGHVEFKCPECEANNGFTFDPDSEREEFECNNCDASFTYSELRMFESGYNQAIIDCIPFSEDYL